MHDPSRLLLTPALLAQNTGGEAEIHGEKYECPSEARGSWVRHVPTGLYQLADSSVLGSGLADKDQEKDRIAIVILEIERKKHR